MFPGISRCMLVGLLAAFLCNLIQAQTTQSNEGFTAIVETYTDTLPKFSTGLGGQKYQYMGDYITTKTVYGRRSTARLLIQTDDQGQTQTYAEVTTYTSGDTYITASSSTETEVASTTSVDYIATPEQPSTAPPSSDLSAGAVAGIAVAAFLVAGTLPAVVVVVIGVCLVWRRPVRAESVPVTGDLRNEDLEQSMVYPKAELHATQRPMYEMDGRVVRELDGIEREGIGELGLCTRARSGDG